MLYHSYHLCLWSATVDYKLPQCTAMQCWILPSTIQELLSRLQLLKHPGQWVRRTQTTPSPADDYHVLRRTMILGYVVFGSPAFDSCKFHLYFGESTHALSTKEWDQWTVEYRLPQIPYIHIYACAEQHPNRYFWEKNSGKDELKKAQNGQQLQP